MSILPTDVVSFIWGAIVGAAGAFGVGFFKKAGEHAYAKIQERVDPAPPEPIEVSHTFQPPATGADYVWVRQERCYELEQQGFTYYLDPKTNAQHCKKGTSWLEFLMIRPANPKD